MSYVSDSVPQTLQNDVEEWGFLCNLMQIKFGQGINVQNVWWAQKQGVFCFCFFKILFIYLFIYFSVAVLGLRFCVRAFSNCSKWGPLFLAAAGSFKLGLLALHGRDRFFFL